MMRIILSGFLWLCISACCHSKKMAENETASKSDSAIVAAKPYPDCIQKLIKTFENEPVQNPPRKIWQYQFKGKTVYYVTSICCDQYSDLYDENCKFLGHPDGGFTGRGDGSVPDFLNEAKNRKEIWSDKRKP